MTEFRMRKVECSQGFQCGNTENNEHPLIQHYAVNSLASACKTMQKGFGQKCFTKGRKYCECRGQRQRILGMSDGSTFSLRPRTIQAWLMLLVSFESKCTSEDTLKSFTQAVTNHNPCMQSIKKFAKRLIFEMSYFKGFRFFWPLICKTLTYM